MLFFRNNGTTSRYDYEMLAVAKQRSPLAWAKMPPNTFEKIVSDALIKSGITKTIRQDANWLI